MVGKLWLITYFIHLSHFIVLLWVCDQHMYSLWIFFLYNIIFPSLFLFPEISVILFLFLLTFTFHSYLLFLLDFELSLSHVSWLKPSNGKENYYVLLEYHKCVVPHFTWMVGPTMNLISGTHHSCEMREYVFIVLQEYIIISPSGVVSTANLFKSIIFLFQIARLDHLQEISVAQFDP